MFRTEHLENVPHMWGPALDSAEVDVAAEVLILQSINQSMHTAFVAESSLFYFIGLFFESIRSNIRNIFGKKTPHLTHVSMLQVDGRDFFFAGSTSECRFLFFVPKEGQRPCLTSVI